MPLRFLLGLVALVVSAASARAASVPLVLFVAGAPSHGPGEHRFPEGCALLANALTQARLPLRVQVSQGWPADDLLAGAQTLVVYSDGLEAHVAVGHAAALRKHLAAGKGLAVMHWALEPGPGELGELLLDAVGGRFDVDWSVNPVWMLQQPKLARHAVTQGVMSFELEDEWYFHLRFRDGVVPVLQALPPSESLGQDGPRTGNAAVRAALAGGEAQTVAWAYERDGRRAFGFTGGHFHRNWSNDSVRKLVLNAIAWTAGVTVPVDGVASSIAPMPRYATIEEAIARGDLEDVRRHVAGDPARVQGKAEASLTPLHQAILRNRTEIALALIAAGADSNRADRSRRTPLHLCVERGNVAVAKALLSQHARPNERDKDGWTPLHHAAAKNNVAIARALLDGGADPMTLSERGGTPLHEAAASGGAEMVKLLLDHHVDPAVVSKTGVTALDIAREYKNEAAVAILAPLAAAKRQ